MNPALSCYSISPDQPFLDRLAEWALQRYGASPQEFTQTLILLPNRRACRSLHEAFLARSGGMPMLLPRIQPIGEVAGEELPFFHEIGLDLPPPMSRTRRHVLLTKLVMDFESSRGNITQGRIFNAAQAAELAHHLGSLLDDVARENLSFERLEQLVPDELAVHWQQTLDFLHILSHHWPRILENEGALDPAVHQYQTLTMLAAHLRAHPPAYPIIAAGSTGSQPATAALLGAIASLPQGTVVLPGLDMHMSEAQWQLVAPTHPQYPLKQLLGRLSIPRASVAPLTGDTAGARSECLNAVFAPAEATAKWRAATLPLEAGVKTIHFAEADTQLDEARMIAAHMRRMLDKAEHTIALVTPDRMLARMTASQLSRFGIQADDSAGRALIDTPVASMMRLVVEMIASRAAPATLLALLRHPLVTAGRDAALCRGLSRRLEIELLRGIRKQEGLKHLRSKDAQVAALLADLDKNLKPLSQLLENKKPASLTALLQAHIQVSEWLAGEALWAGDDGEQMAAFFSELLPHTSLLGPLDAQHYPGLFEFLLLGQSYWPRYGQHPRIHILSPIEARLQRFDHVILGSLNEGTWPAIPAGDPWMSRPMRERFGLPPTERAIGQSAHDVYMLAAASDVTMTRARKNDGVPMVPSRWLVRLQTLVGGLDSECLARMDITDDLRSALRLMNQPAEMAPLVAPAPLPPASARPRKLNVTAIDTWLRDPYMIYARHILKLRKLDAIDQELTAADFGMVVHGALETFTKAWPDALPPDAFEQLLKAGMQAFAPFMDRPAVAALWWPRFEMMAQWFVEQEEQRRHDGMTIYPEMDGRWALALADGEFVLTTRIDRMEMDSSGAATIIDYKTGTLPENKDIESGLSNQLQLEAMIALRGELPLRPADIESLHYWKLAGKAEHCEIKTLALKEGWKDEMIRRVHAMLERFSDPQVAFAAQSDRRLLPRYNDYKHLTRLDEWETV